MNVRCAPTHRAMATGKLGLLTFVILSLGASVATADLTEVTCSGKVQSAVDDGPLKDIRVELRATPFGAPLDSTRTGEAGEFELKDVVAGIDLLYVVYNPGPPCPESPTEPGAPAWNRAAASVTVIEGAQKRYPLDPVFLARCTTPGTVREAGASLAGAVSYGTFEGRADPAWLLLPATDPWKGRVPETGASPAALKPFLDEAARLLGGLEKDPDRLARMHAALTTGNFVDAFVVSAVSAGSKGERPRQLEFAAMLERIGSWEAVPAADRLAGWTDVVARAVRIEAKKNPPLVLDPQDALVVKGGGRDRPWRVEVPGRVEDGPATEEFRRAVLEALKQPGFSTWAARSAFADLATSPEEAALVRRLVDSKDVLVERAARRP